MRLSVRYDSADETGETRRQRNERFGADSPSIDLSSLDDGHVTYFWSLWNWFWEARRSVAAGFNGPQPLSNGEYLSWLRRTGNILRREEGQIIMEMDDAYLAAMAAEQEDRSKRQEGAKTGRAAEVNGG